MKDSFEFGQTCCNFFPKPCNFKKMAADVRKLKYAGHWKCSIDRICPNRKKISKLGSRRKEEDLASAAAARVRKRKREWEGKREREIVRDSRKWERKRKNVFFFNLTFKAFKKVSVFFVTFKWKAKRGFLIFQVLGRFFNLHRIRRFYGSCPVLFPEFPNLARQAPTEVPARV